MIITLKNTRVILHSKACKYLWFHQILGDLMKIWHGYDWNEIMSPNDLGKIYCDNGELYDAYHTLIDGEHIFLLNISTSKNWMKRDDENMTELELKSFWYKSHKKVFGYIFLNS